MPAGASCSLPASPSPRRSRKRAFPPSDVDGLVSYTIDPVEETELVRSVGFREIVWSSRVPYGGGGSMGVLLHAASAVVSGAANTVVAYRAVRARSGASRFGAAKTAPSPTSAHSGTTAMQWCMPYGVLDAGVVDVAQRDALHARLRRHQRRLRPRGRAAACVRGHESRRVGLSEPDHARGSSGSRAGSPSRASASSTVARRPTDRSRSSSRAPSAWLTSGSPRC